MHRRRNLLLALLGLVALTTSACDWTTWRGGPTRTGSNDGETTIAPANADQLHQKWAVPTGPNPSHGSPVVAGDLVVVAFPRMSSDGTRVVGVISAYRASDGRRLWGRAVQDAVSQPTITGNRVIVVVGGRGAGSSRALALDLDTGAQQWVRALPGEVFGLPLAPTSSGARTYVSYSDGFYRGGLVALDSVSGRLVWQRATRVRPQSSPSINRGIVYVPTNLPGLLALDAGDASLVFHRSTTPPSGPAMLRQDLVLVGVEGQAVAAYDAFTGRHRWTTPSDRPFFPDDIALSGDRSIRCVFDPVGVIATDLVTGDTRWKTDDECISVTVANGVASITTPDRIELRNVEDGTQVGKLPLAGWSNSEPVIARGAVYVLVADGTTDLLVKYALP